LSLRLGEYSLSAPRQFGACWLATELWQKLQLDQFWGARLPVTREGTDWARLLQVSVAYRLIHPGSEWRCHRHWFHHSALGDLLGPEFHLGGKDQLYLLLDRLLEHRPALFQHLKARWQDLFGVKYDVLLYDLTSTYFEGAATEIPKAEYGYSRDHRPDCQQVVLALIVTPEGFPLGYEVLPGNTTDKTTLQATLAAIEQQHGKAQRVWLMDRGIPTEEQLAAMRAAQPPVQYLVGTPRARVRHTHAQWQDLPWQQVRDSVRVKLFQEEGELYVVAQSQGRAQKEIAIRRKKLARALRALRRLRRVSSRDQALLRLGAIKSQVGRAWNLLKITLPPAGVAITQANFRFQLDRQALAAAEAYDGHYLLRSNLSGKEPAHLWQLYMLLVEIEGVFKSFKNELEIRPVYHSVGPRVEAHIFVCFLAYCLHVTLRQELRGKAPGLTPRAVLETLATLQMLDVKLPTTDGRVLTLTRVTEPDRAVQLLLHTLGWQLPPQSPPRLSSEQKLTP
jgi:hypothetical protein